MTLLIEHPTDAAGIAHACAVLIEDMADLGGGAVLVIGQNFNDDGDLAGAVALVGAGLVVD